MSCNPLILSPILLPLLALICYLPFFKHCFRIHSFPISDFVLRPLLILIITNTQYRFHFVDVALLKSSVTLDFDTISFHEFRVSMLKKSEVTPLKMPGGFRIFVPTGKPIAKMAAGYKIQKFDRGIYSIFNLFRMLLNPERLSLINNDAISISR
jgi:hypothetical protein